MKQILEAKEVMSHLITLMIAEPETKKFRNIAAVYCIWQTELHNLELEFIK